jgi:hypothetical protein
VSFFATFCHFEFHLFAHNNRQDVPEGDNEEQKAPDYPGLELLRINYW